MQGTGAIRFAVARSLSAIPTLFFVVLLSFAMMRAAPGGPFDAERALPPETRENLEAAYQLDAPLSEQLWAYVGGLLHGDFGPSYRYPGYSVAELMAAALPVSLKLGGLGMLLALVVGVTAGVFAAVLRDSVADRLLTGIALTGISIPVLVIAPVLALVFAVYLGWLPASWTSGDEYRRYVLPVIGIALPQIAYITRLMRASMIEVLASDFVRTGRAQGFSTATIVLKHALKPALLPLLSYMGPAIAAVMAGSVVVEQIFGIPGIGRLFVSGALNRDYTLVLGIVIVYATLVIALNLIVDVLYGFFDPRIRRA